MSEKHTVRLRATWIVEYDATLEDYDVEDSQAAALLDQETDDPVSLMVDGDTVEFRVEPK